MRARMAGAIASSVVSAIAAGIQRQEGYTPGSLAYINNNPGNLVYAGQPGAAAGAGGFARFNSYQDGETALENQISLDVTRGYDVNGRPTTTLAELLTSWAPPDENDTATYIANVSAWTGIDPNVRLDSLGGGTADFVSYLSEPVDLSSVGIASPVPVYGLIAAGLVAAAFLQN